MPTNNAPQSMATAFKSRAWPPLLRSVKYAITVNFCAFREKIAVLKTDQGHQCA
jgi:hypothetical protein